MQGESERRSHIRYDPNCNDLISLVPLNNRVEEKEIIGLLRDISAGGCAGIFHLQHFAFEVGERAQVSTNNEQDKEATVVWTKPIDKQFIKAGFEFK